MNSVEPVVEHRVVRMLSQQGSFPPNRRTYPRITQVWNPMLHRAQALRAQPIAPRLHPLARGLGWALAAPFPRIPPNLPFAHRVQRLISGASNRHPIS